MSSPTKLRNAKAVEAWAALDSDGEMIEYYGPLGNVPHLSALKRAARLIGGTPIRVRITPITTSKRK